MLFPMPLPPLLTPTRMEKMLAPSETPTLVTFRGGFVATWPVVAKLIDLEFRGARFELLDGGRFRVIPPSVLTADDVAFLKAHRDEARRVIQYDADAVTI
jgi:hypothetical protein